MRLHNMFKKTGEKITTGYPQIVAFPVITASSSPVFTLKASTFSVYPRKSNGFSGLSPSSIHSRNRRKPEAPEGILKKCNKCGAAILTDEVINGKYICPKCHGYFRIPA